VTCGISILKLQALFIEAVDKASNHNEEVSEFRMMKETS